MVINPVGAVAIRAVILAGLVMFALNLWILRWTFQLRDKKCACAINAKLSYIQFAMLASLAFFVFEPLLSAVLPMKGTLAIASVMLLISLAYLVVAFIYLRELQKAEDCKCSEGPERTAFYWVNWINIVSTVLLLVGLSFVAYRFAPIIRFMINQGSFK